MRRSNILAQLCLGYKISKDQLEEFIEVKEKLVVEEVSIAKTRRGGGESNTNS